MGFLPPLVQTRGSYNVLSYRCKRGRFADDNEYLLFLSARFRENGQTAMAYVHAKALVASFAKVIQWLAITKLRNQQAGCKGKKTGSSNQRRLNTALMGLVSGETTLTVTNATLASIAVTPTNPSIPNGTTRQFTATGTYSDFTTQDLTTQVAWSSSAAGVATISNAGGSQGLATSVAAGTATITATLGGVSGGTTLTVTAANLSAITVTPTAPSIANSSEVQ